MKILLIAALAGASAADVPARRVGIVYGVWHGPAAMVLNQLIKEGRGAPLTIEDVLRGNGRYTLADLPQKELRQRGFDFYYQSTPQLGFYCLYRARPGEQGLIPDCPDIPAVAKTHAQWLTAAGVDFVVTDNTNQSAKDINGRHEGDLLEVRPTEVLFEEWHKLREQGVPTPQIAVWNQIPAGASEYRDFLALYNRPEYRDLVMRDKRTGKKVFFIVDPPDAKRFPDPGIAREIAWNNGGNDIVVVPMWNERGLPEGHWSFTTQCRAQGKLTTSVVGAGPCDQDYARHSPIGSALSVSPTSGLNYASLPFSSSGKLAGLAFKRQFATAFRVRPDYLIISGFNEFTAQPQTPQKRAKRGQMRPGNPFAQARSMGLESDPEGDWLWVDTFGAEYSRDLEPTKDDGAYYYDLMASCIRAYRKGGCKNSREECCFIGPSRQFQNVFSFVNRANGDHLVASAPARVSRLSRSPNYRQICAAYPGSSVFCTDAQEPEKAGGPFIAYSWSGPDRAPLFSCLGGGGRHFLSKDPGCERQRVEAKIGYVSTVRKGEMPRALNRCHRRPVHFHTLGVPCPPGAQSEGLLGYVR